MYVGGFYFITGQETDTLSFEDMTLRTLQAGVRWVQYRDKDRSRREIYEESIRLTGIAKKFDAVLIINDHPDIALAADADGVHLGQDDLPVKEARKIMGKRKIIGVSTHTVRRGAREPTGRSRLHRIRTCISYHDKRRRKPQGN